MRRTFAAATIILLATLSPANARQAVDRVDSIYTSSGYVVGKARFVPKQKNARRAIRVQTRAALKRWRYSSRTKRIVHIDRRTFTTKQSVVGLGGSEPHYVAQAKRWIGYRPSLADLQRWAPETGAENPWGRKLKSAILHCAVGLNMVLVRAGLPSTRSNFARSFFGYGSAAPGPAVGTIYVRKSHVGLVVALSARGNPMVLGFNQGRGKTTVMEVKRHSGSYRWPPGVS